MDVATVVGMCAIAAPATVALVLVLEAGLLIGIVLPAGSLVLGLGVLAVVGIVSLPVVALTVAAATVLGAALGHCAARHRVDGGSPAGVGLGPRLPARAALLPHYGRRWWDGSHFTVFKSPLGHSIVPVFLQSGARGALGLHHAEAEPDLQPAGVEVHVPPAQREHLAAAHPCRGQQPLLIRTVVFVPVASSECGSAAATSRGERGRSQLPARPSR